MAMNPTTVLRHVRRKLGASLHELELDEDDIMQTVYDESVPTFSQYFPHLTKISVEENDEVEEDTGIYYIKTDYEILSVTKLFKNEFDYRGAVNRTITRNPAARRISNDMRSAVKNPETFKYIPPNKVEIFPKHMWLKDFMVEIAAIHPKHLNTVPMKYRKEFLDLCEYDVKDALYQIRNHFQSINTSFGSIELFIQDLESASDDREQLIERWERNYFKDSRRKKVHFY